MSWTSARVAGSLLAAATATLAMAVPASADAPTPHQQNPGVGASNTVACGISYPDKDNHEGYSAGEVEMQTNHR